MKWATRRAIHVDRAACAWLIRRFIDDDAEFVFVEDPSDVPDDATPFDIRGAKLSHHEGRCSFESILLDHALTVDPVLDDIARTIHQADLGDDRYDAPTATGLDVLIRGLTMTNTDDDATLQITDQLFDALYTHTQRRLLTGHTPS